MGSPWNRLLERLQTSELDKTKEVLSKQDITSGKSNSSRAMSYKQNKLFAYITNKDRDTIHEFFILK